MLGCNCDQRYTVNGSSAHTWSRDDKILTSLSILSNLLLLVRLILLQAICFLAAVSKARCTVAKVPLPRQCEVTMKPERYFCLVRMATKFIPSIVIMFLLENECTMDIWPNKVVNRMIVHILHMYKSKYPCTWDKSLPYVQQNYNRAFHNSTSHSSFSVELGFQPLCPIDVVIPFAAPHADSAHVVSEVDRANSFIEHSTQPPISP